VKYKGQTKIITKKHAKEKKLKRVQQTKKKKKEEHVRNKQHIQETVAVVCKRLRLKLNSS
jgi:hypothetical protein